MKEIKVHTMSGYLDGDIYLINLYNALKNHSVKAYDLKNPFAMFTADIIHLHWVEYYISSKSLLKTMIKITLFPLLFLFLKHVFQKKIMISLHNVEMQQKHFPRIEKWGFNFYLSKIAHKVIVFSEWQKKELKKNYDVVLRKEQIARTDLTSYIGHYKTNISKKQARKKLGIKDNKLVILMFGRLDEYKGVNDVINFLKKQKKRNYAVLFAGKPQNDNVKNEILKLKEKQKDSIFFKTGYFSKDDIEEIMSASDIGLLAQNTITNSGVLYLFGAFKKPILARYSYAFEETLKDNALYYKNDTELKQVLKKLNQKKAKKLGNSFYNDIKHVTWKKISKDTRNIYEKLLENK